MEIGQKQILPCINFLLLLNKTYELLPFLINGSPDKAQKYTFQSQVKKIKRNPYLF